MAKVDFRSVDAYIAAQPEPARAVLERVRRAIRNALPGAEEVISYQIPAYRLSGGLVLFFAGWRQHYSLYPATDSVVAAFKDELASYKVGKGTIRFPLGEPVPAALIARLAKYRAREVAASQMQKAKAAVPKKPRVAARGRRPG